MPRSRLSMRHIREVLRLRWELGLSVRATARGCGLTHPTVLKYVQRAEACGLSWPLPARSGTIRSWSGGCFRRYRRRGFRVRSPIGPRCIAR